MRKIKFRAQGRASGNWYYGYLTYQSKHYCIVEENGNVVEIDPRTIGQYTGLKDCEGNKIYEGDILKVTNEKGWSRLFVVEYNEDAAGFILDYSYKTGDTSQNIDFDCDYAFQSEKLGNIHEDEYLLETENEE